MKKIEKILEFIDSQGTNKSAFEQKSGISNGYLANIKKTGSEISGKMLSKMYKAYPELENYLEDSDNTPTKPTGDDLRKQKAFGEKEKQGVGYVPIPAQAGYSKHFYEPVFRHNLQRYPYPLPYEGDRFMVFQVKGSSMEYYDQNNKPAGLFEGMDIVCEIVDPEDWKKGQIPPYHIYVVVKEDEIVVKRILIKDNGDYVMHSDNPDEKPRQRPLKKHDIKELWYVKRKVDWDLAPPDRIEIEI